MTTVADLLAHPAPLTLDPDYDGGCPCAVIWIDEAQVDVHCWRTCLACEYSGIHVTGTLPESTRIEIAKYVRDHNPWTDGTHWTISTEGRS